MAHWANNGLNGSYFAKLSSLDVFMSLALPQIVKWCDKTWT